MIDGISFGNIMIDCDDEQKLCEFYHKLLGWEKGIRFASAQRIMPNWM